MQSGKKNTPSGLCANEVCSKLCATVKFCRFSSRKRCFHESCSFIDSNGNVKLCRLHRNPSGRFTPHICKEVR